MRNFRFPAGYAALDDFGRQYDADAVDRLVFLFDILDQQVEGFRAELFDRLPHVGDGRFVDVEGFVAVETGHGEVLRNAPAVAENGCQSVPLLPPVLHCPFRRKKVKGGLRPFFICCTR